MISASTRRTFLAALGVTAALACGAALPAAHAQGRWTTFLNGRNLSSLAVQGGQLWAGGSGGATRVPLAGGDSAFVLLKSSAGLPSNRITALHVTPDGALWFGLETDGLARLDPATGAWKYIDKAFGLPDNRITALGDDGQNLTIGTKGGFALLSGEDVLVSCSAVQDSCLPALGVTSLAYGPRTRGGFGPYFVATQNGVSAYDGQAWNFLRRGLPAGPVAAVLLRGSDSTLFAAAGNTLYALRDSAWQALASAPDAILSLALRDTTLYVGRQGGVSRLVAGALEAVRDGAGGELGKPARALVVRSDTLWVATGNGLIRLSGGSWNDVFAGYRLDQPTRNGVTEIALETGAHPRAWMLVFPSTALMVYDPAAASGARWTDKSPPASTPDNQPTNIGLHALYVDPLQRKWIGHASGTDRSKFGLHVLDDRSGADSWQYLLSPPHNILVIRPDPAGRVWFGASDPGDSLYVYPSATDAPLDRARFQGRSTLTPNWRLPTVVLASLGFHGLDGWAGAYGGQNGGGLMHWRPEGTDTVFTQYSSRLSTLDPHYIANELVRGGVVVTGDTAWIGTAGGLSLISESADYVLDNIVAPDSRIPSSNITALATAPNGDVWIGTDNGLVLYRAGTWTTYSTRNSLLVDDAVQCLTVDATRTPYELWIGTATGVSRLAVDAPTTNTGTSTTLRFYPHPFRPGHGDRLHLAGGFLTPASVKIYDARGRVVVEFTAVSSGQAFWDGRDAAGNPVGSGLYRARVEADGVVTRMSLAVVR